MTYCLPAWGATHSSYVDRIIMLPKRAIRLICGATQFSHTVPAASQYTVLLFSDVYLKKLL